MNTATDPPTVVGIPKEGHLKYYGEIDVTRSFVIYVAYDESAYREDFFAYIGPKAKLDRVEITEAKRYSDGGTTIVTTTQGMFFFAPFNAEASFEGKPLLKLYKR